MDINLKCKRKYFINSSGQSLLEVVVAVILVTTALTGLISVISLSLSNVQNSRTKTQAAKYAQEAIEWLRSEKENWSAFNSKIVNAGNGASASYCLNDLSWLSSGTCSSYGLDNIYKRQILLTRNSDNEIKITATMYWMQGNDIKNIAVHTIFTNKY